MAALSVGNELKDSYKETAQWVQHHLDWLHDLESFYRERSKLEREYSEKLQQLAQQHFQKKAAHSVALGVGETPTVTPGSIESATVVTWNEILSQTELIAKDHAKLSQQLDQTVAGSISGLYTKLDMTMTKVKGFHQEMSERKDVSYNDLQKAKKRYDDACSAMELARNRYTKGNNERNKRKVQEKETQMNIMKNAYLIKISIANRVKDKYYFQDIPEVVDLLQDLNESKTLFLNDIWVNANKIEISHCDTVAKRLKTATNVVEQNKPSLNTAMFIKHNMKKWKEPNDFQFKESPIWHDDESFTIPSNTELNELKILLAQSTDNYNKMSDLSTNEMSQLSTLNKLKQEFKSNEDKINSDKFYDTLKKYLSLVSSFTNHETSKLISEVTIQCIQNNTPDDMDLSIENIDLTKNKRKSLGGFLKLGLSSNNSSTTTSSIPTNYKNKPHNLFSFKTIGKKTKNTDNVDNNTNNNTYNNNDNLSINESIHEQKSIYTTTTTTSSSIPSQNTHANKVLYAYEKQDDDEITIHLGDTIELIQKDNGSGWTQIKNITMGTSGLVPTTYIQIQEPPTTSSPHATTTTTRSKPPTAPPPRRNTIINRTITAQFAYQATDDDELSLQVGDVINVIRGDDGSGWTYGELNGIKGLVPTSYCK